MKRTLSILLAIVMCIGVFSSVVSAASFTDVKASQYYYDAVTWAVDKGVTNGTSDTTFSPNANCTRGQVVTFLWRASGSPEPASSTNPFTDVKSSQYYYKAVLWAVEKGITTGMTATTFGPNASCTRAQVVTFLNRTAGTPAPASSTNPFTDVKSSQYYYKAVLWAVEKGITTGMTATTFGPNATCTRGQIVTFLYRYVKSAIPDLAISAITLDKTLVKIGDTISPSVTVQGGVAPYTVEWSYYLGEAKHVIAGATTVNPTITVTDGMFDNLGKMKLSCKATDAEGRTDTVDECAMIDKLLDLTVTLADVRLKKDDFQAVGGELVSVFHLNATVTGADPKECTYKWEWSPVGDGIQREIFKDVPSGGNHDFIIAKQTNDPVNAPSALVKHSFLDKPIFVKVTVTDPLGRTASSVKMVYRDLKGSTGAYNVVGYTHTVTPKGGNGTYTYQWGYTTPGETGTFEEFDSNLYTCTGNQLGMGIELHRVLYNMGVRKITCTITSAGVSETVEFSFS